MTSIEYAIFWFLYLIGLAALVSYAPDIAGAYFTIWQTVQHNKRY